ncbi:MAG: NAD(P)H-binding protein [Gemmatimonadota bacterium]|nr:NAD(P)H-binding protein [Gemmatimonadota bacterium]
MTRSQPTHSSPPETVLITGATGYIGSRLLRRLEEGARRVRCLVRRPDALSSMESTDVEVAEGDLLRPETLPAAMQGVSTAYYLVHSMASGGDFELEDRKAAINFAEAALAAGLQRIVYLGGLGNGRPLSGHLESRREVGEILRKSGVPTIEFRASIIIGSGSLSFEMIRALVEKLPVMLTPKWVHTRCQPIAVDDVLDYMVNALDLPSTVSGHGQVFEIGGPDRASYRDLMSEYARQRGLRRMLISVPLLSPRLSSLWLNLFTPVYARIGRKLVESLRNETVVVDESALEAFRIRPRSMAEAVQRALDNEEMDDPKATARSDTDKASETTS